MKDDVAGLILAGGRSRRLGGVDKGWQSYKGRPLVQHAMNQLSACSEIIISANRNLDAYRKLDVKVVPDARAGYQGPLSGIESAMKECRSAYLYVVPCDVLGVALDWQVELLKQVQDTGSAWVGTRDSERLQPLLGLWSCSLLPVLTKYLDEGGRRVMEFVQPFEKYALALPDDTHLLNLNTPEAFVAAEKKDD